jgi:hypothetical protein
VGLILSILIAILIAMFDTVVHSEEDLTSTFSIPILGVIPALIQMSTEGHTDMLQKSKKADFKSEKEYIVSPDRARKSILSPTAPSPRGSI